MTRFSAACVVGLIASGLVACGDGENNDSAGLTATGNGGSSAKGGASSKGGVSGDEGGSSNQGSGTLNLGGYGYNSAGAGGETAGAAGMTGGETASGGSTAEGGSSASGGEKATGGGTSEGGSSASGGSSTEGGSSALGGGAALGGETATGGATAEGGSSAVGGEAALGGSAGSGEGGSSAGGTSAVTACTATMVLPTANAILSDSSDVSGDYCADGLQYNVLVTTNAADGTDAILYIDSNAVELHATVTSGVAQFSAVDLGDSGSSPQLHVEVGSGDSGCSTSNVTVTLNCAGTPTQCALASATYDATARTALNGVAVAEGGDRVSAEGSDYQTGFVVTTDLATGETVTIVATDGDGATTSTSSVVGSNGKATFNGLTLDPDGTYSLTATCTTKAGASLSSSTQSFAVDTAAPDLTLTKGTGSGAVTMSALAAGDHFSLDDDADSSTDGLQMKFCGATNAADASDLIDVLTGNYENFCVSYGGNTPVCAEVTGDTSPCSGCVNLDCPGSGSFELEFTLKDSAQNVTTVTRSGLSCSSNALNVTFLTPVADDGTIGTRILSANNEKSTVVYRDSSPDELGAQFNVKACTSAESLTGTLSVGHVGDYAGGIAAALATATSTLSSDCSTGYLLDFGTVTLPESEVDDSGALTAAGATELTVAVADGSSGTGSATIGVWVDSTDPTLSVVSPAGLCGKTYSGTETITTAVTLATTPDDAAVEVALTLSGSTTDSYTATTSSGSVTFSGVEFAVGSTDVTGTAEEGSGNYVEISDCSVAVSNAAVTWVLPGASGTVWYLAADQNASDIDPRREDSDSGTTGWQGTLKVCLTSEAELTDEKVTFYAGDEVIGEADVVPESETYGCATLEDASIADGPAGGADVVLLAVASGDAGVGAASLPVKVDTTVPSVPTAIAATVTERRLPSFTLDWTAAADGTGAASSYEVRYSTVGPIDDSIVAFDDASSIAWSGSPGTSGTEEAVLVSRDTAADGVVIEGDYYFAVRAVDVVGNLSPIAYTEESVSGNFQTVEIAAPTTSLTNFGWVVDGGSDVNCDGLSDLIVGSEVGTTVYIYLGTSDGVGIDPTGTVTPSLSIEGDDGYGNAVAGIGDVNGDGCDDIAIGNQNANDYSGVVDVFYGRRTWKSDVTSTIALLDDAFDLRIKVDNSLDAYMYSCLGTSVARIGDIDDDGYDDFALGSPYYNVGVNIFGQGQVAIVLGKTRATGTTLVLPDDFGTTSGVLQIDGPLESGNDKTGFGHDMVGIGSFYGGDNVLVIAAPYANSSSTDTVGAMYAYDAYSYDVDGAMLWSSYSDHVFGTIGDSGDGNVGLGRNGLGVLGAFGSDGRNVIGAFYSRSNAPGEVLMLSGSTSTGPFAKYEWLQSSEAGSIREFGQVVIGGAIRGTANQSLSYVGDDTSDILVSTIVGADARLFLVDGDALSLVNGSAVPQALASATLTMPGHSGGGTFVNFGMQNTPALDFDGDGYPDFAVGEVGYSSAIEGRVLVYR